jgi:mono/diheme cytochrome c family protein
MRIIIPVFAALAAAHTPPAAHAETASIEEGRQIAQKFCASCHAIGLKGDSPHADAPPFRQIAANRDATHLKGILGEGVIVGHPNMPQWQFRTEDARSLIAYLKSLAGRG